MRASLLSVLCLCLVVACDCDPDRPTRDGGGGDTGQDMFVADDVNRPEIPPQGDDSCTKIDFLFVIDDSGSMGEEQANLVANFPQFVQVIDDYRSMNGQPLDYRIAVTTTGGPNRTTFDLSGLPLPIPIPDIVEDGPNGELINNSSCGMTRQWIESSDNDVAGTFQCAANVGTGGSSTEKPLLMMSRAFTDRVADGSNAQFAREDALLAVVILTDEDDCSTTREEQVISLTSPTNPQGAADECDPNQSDFFTIPQAIASMDMVKGDRGRWAVAVIAGPTNCESSFGSAAAATRLQSFVNDVGDNAVFSSICEGDLSGALNDALNTFDAACQNFVLI